MTEPVRYSILDIDGTLVDSNDAHAHAWVRAMEENGYRVPFERVRPLIGMGGDKVLPELLGLSKESESGQRITRRRKELFFSEYLPHIQAFPQAWELLLHMRGSGLTLMIASSAEPDELQALLRCIHPQASELFAEQTSSKDTSRSKPDADVIQVTLQHLDARPEETLMLGDTAYDIEAAARSSVKTIALRCGGWSDQDLQGALVIYNDPADLLASYKKSPLFLLARV